MHVIPGFNGSRFLRWLLLGAAAPVNIVAPVASGTGYVGYTLSVTTGTWRGRPEPATFTYQWQRLTPSGVVNLGTASTHVVTLDDEGVPVRCVVTATNPAGSSSANSNAIEQWVPTDAGTVDGWWDAYSPATITIATGISAWTSRGSKANGDLSQLTAAQQPAYGATAWDGSRPCATFDGSDDMVRTTTSGSFGQNVGGITIAGAVELASLGIDRAALSVSTDNPVLARASPRSGTAGSGTFSTTGRRLDADSFSQIDFKTFAVGTHLFVSQHDHTNDRARTVVDGTVAAWVTPFKGAGNTSDTANASLSLGSNPGGDNNRWSGKMAEVIYYDSTLSDADLDKLNGYLAWRWGVTANLDSGHPYKTVAPTAAAPAPVNISAPVISGTGYIGYTLTATGGEWHGHPVLTYQWQRFVGGVWVNIGAANTSVYTVVIADEGVPVRCVVTATNAVGVTTANSNSIEQWVPTDIGSDLENWWDAEDASKITLATGVSQWSSKGELLDHVSQGGASNQPAYSATGWLGVRPGITFDGANDWLRRTASKDRARNVDGYRIACAWKSNSGNTYETRILSIDGPSAARVTDGLGPSGTGATMDMGARRLDGDTYAFSNPSGLADDFAAHVRVSRFLFATGEAQQRIDGTASAILAPFTAGFTSDTYSAVVAIGASSGAGNIIGGVAHEILAIRSSGTDAENEKIEAYLAWRARLVGSLPSGHPYKTVAPTP